MSTLDPTYLENVQSYEVFDKSGFGEVMTLVNVNPTILEECQLCMHVDHEDNILCDSYIVGRMWGSGKPSRFEHWGAREVFLSYRSTP